MGKRGKEVTQRDMGMKWWGNRGNRGAGGRGGKAGGWCVGQEGRQVVTAMRHCINAAVFSCLGEEVLRGCGVGAGKSGMWPGGGGELGPFSARVASTNNLTQRNINEPPSYSPSPSSPLPLSAPVHSRAAALPVSAEASFRAGGMAHRHIILEGSAWHDTQEAPGQGEQGVRGLG